MKTVKKLLAICLMLGLIVVSAAIPASAANVYDDGVQYSYPTYQLYFNNNTDTTQVTSGTYGKIFFGPLDVTQYKYIEFDVQFSARSGCTVSDSGDYRIVLNSQAATGTSTAYTQQTSNPAVAIDGTLRHVAIPLSDFKNYGADLTQIDALYVNNVQPRTQIFLINVAFTHPQAVAASSSQVYYKNDSGSVATSSKAFFGPFDITQYNYIEFDTCFQSRSGCTATNSGEYRIVLNSQAETGTSTAYSQISKFKAIALDQNLVHVILPLDSETFRNYGADLTKIDTIYVNNVQPHQLAFIANIVFTKESDYCINYGHTASAAVVENETPTGYDSVVYCSVCGEEISRNHVDVIPGNLSVATQRKGDEARLVIKLTGEAAAIEAYEDITVDYSLDGTEYSVSLDALYDSFINEDEVVSAASLSCTYIAILEIGDVQGVSTIVATASYTAGGETVTGPTRTTNAGRVYQSWK